MRIFGSIAAVLAIFCADAAVSAVTYKYSSTVFHGSEAPLFFLTVDDYITDQHVFDASAFDYCYAGSFSTAFPPGSCTSVQFFTSDPLTGGAYFVISDSTGSNTLVTFTEPNPFAGNGVYESEPLGYTISSTLTVSGEPVNPVPEPASWAMMIMGFGLVGFAMRHETRRVSVSEA